MKLRTMKSFTFIFAVFVFMLLASLRGYAEDVTIVTLSPAELAALPSELVVVEEAPALPEGNFTGGNAIPTRPGDSNTLAQQQTEELLLPQAQDGKNSWGLFIVPAALIVLLITYILWMRRKPEA